MAAGKAASAIVKGLSKILRDVKSKPSTTSGKKTRRRMTIEDKPTTKTAQRKNQQ